MSESPEKDPDHKKLHAALVESAALSATILSRCIEESGEYFRLNPELLAKVSERLDRGRELAELGNYRAANIIQRHAIDLILQENHMVFKDSASLRKALLHYRDHDEHVLVPLWERLGRSS